MNPNIVRTQVRLPVKLAEWLRQQAKREYKSMNRTLVDILEKAKNADPQ